MAKDIKLSKVIIDILANITDILKKQKIPYAFMGGIALQAWGKERVTRDIDITISLGEIAKEDFLNILRKEGLKLVHAEREKRIGSFCLIETNYIHSDLGIPIEIDFFITETEYQRQALKRAVAIKIMGYSFKLVSPEDLIIHKLLSDRPIDRNDVREIIIEQKVRLDREYLFLWAKRLGTPRRLKELWKNSDKDYTDLKT